MRTVIWRKGLKNETPIPIGHPRFREVLLGWDDFSLYSVEQYNLLVILFLAEIIILRTSLLTVDTKFF